MQMINQTFKNLAQRSVSYYLATYPPFFPVQSSEATDEEQKNAYLFIKGIYERIYNDPTLIGFKILPDDSFNDWEFHKTKPQLVTKIRDGIKKIDQFLALIFNICTYNQIDQNTFSVSKTDNPIKTAAIKQLAKFDIQVKTTDNEYLFSFPIKTGGLKLLANISKQSASMDNEVQQAYTLFSRGVFDVSSPWTLEIFKNMFNDQESYGKLMDFLIKNNYLRNDFRENINLNFVKNYGNVDEKLKAAWAERTHGGIEIIYEETRKNQPLISLRIPYYLEILKNADKMSEGLKSFVVNTSKKCDNCRYCVQTDKTGKRPLAFITVEEFNICPLFCGFQYRWKTINPVLADNMIEMLQFIHELFQ
jgi:hypothetical protein